MNTPHPARALLLALVLALAPPALYAQATALTPAKDRITDEAVQADHKAYESLQVRIKGLNDRGRPVRDYFLSKAQCWLDVSFHEYTRNDRSAFPQAAMTESEKLIASMEQGINPLPTDTPLVNGAARLRPDLWDRASALRGHAGWRCATQKAACAEVELVHAGNESNQQQWRHAKPYVQIAEDLLGEAQALADSCVPPPAPPPPPPPPVLPLPLARVTPAPPPVQDLVLTAQVLFEFDRHESKNALPASWVQLEELVRQVQREGLVVQGIELDGHADRLNGSRLYDYNQGLSERRVATVKAEFVRLGVAPALISTAASGDFVQVQGCDATRLRGTGLQACMQPNRRVEVQIRARKP